MRYASNTKGPWNASVALDDSVQVEHGQCGDQAACSMAEPWPGQLSVGGASPLHHAPRRGFRSLCVQWLLIPVQSGRLLNIVAERLKLGFRAMRFSALRWWRVPTAGKRLWPGHESR